MADEKPERKVTKINKPPQGSKENIEEPVSGDPEGDKLQKRIDPLDHAIAETLMLEPAITNPELAKRFDVSRFTILKRRHRPVFLRYMVYLRKDGIELLKQASKKAAKRVNEALDAIQGKGRHPRPDHWVRLAAARMINDANYGKRGQAAGGRGSSGSVQGVPQDEVPALAGALVVGYRGKDGQKPKPRPKRKKPKKKKPKPKTKPKDKKKGS